MSIFRYTLTPDQQYSELRDAPKGPQFARYAKNIDLFESEHFSQLSKWLRDNGYALDSEIAYLASFAYIAGGWTTDTPEALIATHGIESMNEAVEAATGGKLDDFSAYDTQHSHRKVNASRIKETFQSLEPFSFSGQPVSSFEQFFEMLFEYHDDLVKQDGQENAAHETFVEAWDSLQSVSYFGPLTGYDWLEVVVSVHEHEQVAPPHLRPEYIKTGSSPPKGFKEVFGMGLQNEQATHCVQLLEDFAREELSKAMPSAMFDMESCLCVFYKDLEGDRIPCTNAPESDCFPDRTDDCY